MNKCDICGTTENLVGEHLTNDHTNLFLNYRCRNCEDFVGLEDSWVLTNSLDKKEITNQKYCELRDKINMKEREYWRKKHIKWDREFEKERKNKLKRILAYFG